MTPALLVRWQIHRTGSIRGFALIELLISTVIACTLMCVLLRLAVTAQESSRTFGNVQDLQQRLRVAAEAIAADLLMAGAGPLSAGWPAGLAGVLPPIVPARTGARSPDAELSHYADRVTILYVPESAPHSALRVGMGSADAPLAIDEGSAGCTGDDTCGFAAGDLLLVVDGQETGAPYDLFTAVDADAGLVFHDLPLSRAYPANSQVMRVRQRVYYLDRSTSRLMVYDGRASDVPLVDHIVDLRVEYYADPSSSAIAAPEGGPSCVYAEGPPPVPLLADLGGTALKRLTAAQLTDGPVCGASPYRFDADLLRVRRMQVVIRAEAESVELRGTGPRFAHAGIAQGGVRWIPDRQIVFDVAPRNLNLSR
jgi:type II secretory pathway pseudopilin PulG